MNAIVGMSHLISKTALNPTQANYIHKIKDASSILLHIINDIWIFLKLKLGKMEVESVVFDLLRIEKLFLFFRFSQKNWIWIKFCAYKPLF